MTAAAESHGIAKQLESFAIPIERLELDDMNARVGDVDAVSRSLERFGQRVPLVVRTEPQGKGKTKRMIVVAGNHRLKAAQHLGWTHVAVIEADDLDDDELRAFAIADNRTSDLAVFDDMRLAEQLETLDADLLAAVSFTDTDINKLLEALDETPITDFGDGSPQLSDVTYALMIECDSEQQQGELLQELLEREVTVRPVML